MEFPYDLKSEFGRGRVKVHTTFDGEPLERSCHEQESSGVFWDRHAPFGEGDSSLLDVIQNPLIGVLGMLEIWIFS